MKTFKKLVMLLCLGILMIGIMAAFAGCSVDYRDDSEIYSCYYYAVDGVDMSSEIVYYTLELRTDKVLVTRYKTKKNSDSGRDDYYVEGNSLVVTTYYGSKKYDIAGNEIIISEFVDGAYVLAKFRLTQSIKPITMDIYSCYERVSGEDNAITDLRYLIVSFSMDGDFTLWYRDNEKRESFSGTYNAYDWGYIAVENMKTGDTEEVENESAPREWRFEFQNNVMVLKEETGGILRIFKFQKTQSAQNAGDE